MSFCVYTEIVAACPFLNIVQFVYAAVDVAGWNDQVNVVGEFEHMVSWSDWMEIWGGDIDDEETFDNHVAELMQYLRQQNIDANSQRKLDVTRRRYKM